VNTLCKPQNRLTVIKETYRLHLKSWLKINIYKTGMKMLFLYTEKMLTYNITVDKIDV